MSGNQKLLAILKKKKMHQPYVNEGDKRAGKEGYQYIHPRIHFYLHHHPTFPFACLWENNPLVVHGNWLGNVCEVRRFLTAWGVRAWSSEGKSEGKIWGEIWGRNRWRHLRGGSVSGDSSWQFCDFIFYFILFGIRWRWQFRKNVCNSIQLKEWDEKIHDGYIFHHSLAK